MHGMLLCHSVPCPTMLSSPQQDLSNMLWGLASLGISPDPAWLQQYMQVRVQPGAGVGNSYYCGV